MDPITAWALAIKAIAELLTEIVKGQPPEVKRQQWDWWIDFEKRMRKLFKVDEAS